MLNYPLVRMINLLVLLLEVQIIMGSFFIYISVFDTLGKSAARRSGASRSPESTLDWVPTFESVRKYLKSAVTSPQVAA